MTQSKDIIFNLTNRPLDYNQLDGLSETSIIMERKYFGNAMLTTMLNIFDEDHYIHSGRSPKQIASDIATTVHRIINQYEMNSKQPIGLRKVILGCGVPQLLISDLELEFISRGYIVLYSVYNRGKTLVTKQNTTVEYTTYQHQRWVEK